MAEPKKTSSWLAAAKATPSAASSPSSSPDQGSMLKSFCNALENAGKESSNFVTVLPSSQRRKSTTPQKTGKQLLPQGDEFPALESPPKSSSPNRGGTKTGKEGGGKSGASERSIGAWGADAVKLIKLPTRNREEKLPGGRTTKIDQNGEQMQAGPAPPPEVKQTQNPVMTPITGDPAVGTTRARPPPEVTADFEGLMNELLTGLRSQGSEQGFSAPLTNNSQPKGLVQAKLILPPKAHANLHKAAAVLIGPAQNDLSNPPRHTISLSRVLFPNAQTPPPTPIAKPPNPGTIRTKPVTPARWPVPPIQGPIHSSQTFPPKEVSFFAVPPKPSASHSPKSVLDLSSPEGSPSAASLRQQLPANQTPPARPEGSPSAASLRQPLPANQTLPARPEGFPSAASLRQQLPANQTPPVRPSAYRPAMHADPKVIGRRADIRTAVPDIMTSTPFSYSLWGSTDRPMTSVEANVLRESPCNVVRDVNPVKVSRLGAWLGKESSGLLETESDFHQALFRGKVAQPAPFEQPAAAETGPEDDDSCCKICFERESNSAYLCGHMLCFDCAQHIHVHEKVCPFCAKPIETVLRVFA